ncbi:MAG TPA: 50S ribosomal protein L22 [Nitrospinota bacterium]|jgi:large subunit ribosomal protein L22|nr:50S ribosomal protein L22 [Nitrospinota bacterium]|tara:strand:- start:221500 stop:222096 length:597 start_codon:yes stop_codon:yes gene_type:complete
MEAIDARATLRFFRISPQKTRIVANMIRGMRAEEAVKTLAFSKRRSARVLLKLLKSAIANAEERNVEDTEILDISEIWVGQGPVQRRYLSRARGRVDVLRKPTSHVTIVLKEDLEAKREAEAKRAAAEAKRAKRRASKKKETSKQKKPTEDKPVEAESKSKKAVKKETEPKKPITKAKAKAKAKAKGKSKGEEKGKKE